MVGTDAETGVDELPLAPYELDEIGCSDDVIDTIEELAVSDMSSARRFAIGKEPVVAVTPAEGVVVRG